MFLAGVTAVMTAVTACDEATHTEAAATAARRPNEALIT